MSRLLQSTTDKLRDYLIKPHKMTSGVSSLDSLKFHAVFLMYAASFLIFIRDPFFTQYGVFTFKQGIMPILLAYMLMATLCWELSFFGKSSGGNLLLQIFMLAPLTIFLARICAEPSSGESSWMQQILDFSTKNPFGPLGKFSQLIPNWLIDICRNWKLSLLFILFVCSQCFRKLSLRLSMLVTMFLIPALVTLQSGADIRYFVGGTLLLSIGASMQFCRYDKIIFFENVAYKLKDGGDKTMLLCIMSIMSKLAEKKQLSETYVCHIIKNEYEKIGQFSDIEMHEITSKIIKMMIYDYSLVRLRNDADGAYITPAEGLDKNTGLLAELTLFPKIVVLLLVTAIWILMPFDILPDSIPFIGALDDVAIALLSGTAIKNCVKR